MPQPKRNIKKVKRNSIYTTTSRHSAPGKWLFMAFAFLAFWLAQSPPWLSVAIASTGETADVQYALVVGHNKGQGLPTLDYAEKDARRFKQILLELGGFRKSQVHMLISPTLKQLRATMQELQEKMAKSKDKQGKFLFYYSGHSRPRHFQLASEKMAFVELMAFVKKLPVYLRLVIIDSCYSGRIIKGKGGRARTKGAAQAHFVNWRRRQRITQRVKGLAVLASSGASERSYESLRLGSSFFTSSLLAGLRGAADRNNDQKVSLTEAYQYARRQTLLLSVKHNVSGVQRPVYLWKLEGSSPLILTQIQRAESQLSFSSSLRGHCFLFRDNKLVHEFEKRAGHPVIVGVQSGMYQIQLRRPDGWLGVKETRVAAHEKKQIDAVVWRRVQPRDNQARGDLRDSTFGIGLLGQYSPVSPLSIHGFGLVVAFDLQPWLRLDLRYRFSPINNETRPYQTHALGIRFAFGWGFNVSELGLWFGAFAEPRLTIRVLTSTLGSFLNIGTLFGGMAQLNYPFAPGWSLRLSLGGGGHLVFFDQTTQISPSLDLAAGIVWNF